MYQRKIPGDLYCGLDITFEVIGGKWKAGLIRHIHKGVKRPGELHKVFPGASPRVLNQQLAKLTKHGIIQKEIFPVLPLKVEYSLTEIGHSLLPIIKWANQ
jgi:DNA-binding HxlR family transcriptional regulator